MKTEVKKDILDAIQMMSSNNPTYQTLWNRIMGYGLDSREVSNWLVQFDWCEDAMDFMLYYGN